MAKNRRNQEPMENFPILNLVRYEWRSKEGNKWRVPKMNINVQIADTDWMHFQGDNFDYDNRACILGKNGDKGTRYDYLMAVNCDDKEITRLVWDKSNSQKMVKDIFQDICFHDYVAYLVVVRVFTWYKAATEDEQAVNGGIIFGERRPGEELDIFVIKPSKKNGKIVTWKELIDEADSLKKEREEAYKYPPKEKPEFPGIHKALKEGCKMYAWLSGGGLRCVSLYVGELYHGEVDKAYGEQPHIEDALKHLEENFLAGKRDYKGVFGKLYPHFLNGSSTSTSDIDNWIRRGYNFDCWQEGEEIIFRLKGYAHAEIPKEILDKAERMGESIVWHDKRGFIRQIHFDPRLGGCVAKVIKSPDNKKDAYLYKITKTGKGKTFWEAMTNAFKAEEVETDGE